MKLLLSAFLLLGTTARAQSSNGYVFVAPGAISAGGSSQATLQAGGGGEFLIGKGIGAGAELSALAPTRSWDDAVGVFSPNGYYHFIHRKQARIDPFVTAGYTLLFRTGHANLMNFGGGVNIWGTRHFGARLEFRDHITTQGTTVHYWGFRFGLAFR